MYFWRTWHLHCDYVCPPLFATKVINGIMVPSFFCISKVFVWKCVWPLSLSPSLFISSPSFSLWFHDTCHLMLFTQYSLLDQFYFCTSCLSIAHFKFTNKIHQLFTDYLFTTTILRAAWNTSFSLSGQPSSSSIARGQSAGKEGKKKNQAPKNFIFYRQRPVSRQGRKKNFSGPKKFYFLSPEASQQGRKKTLQAPKSFIFYRQRPASWVDGCRSSRIQSCSRRALHLCDNVTDVTTQAQEAQEAQRPIRLRFKNPCKRLWIVEKKIGSWKVFFLGVGPWKEGPQATFFLRINEVKP